MRVIERVRLRDSLSRLARGACAASVLVGTLASVGLPAPADAAQPRRAVDREPETLGEWAAREARGAIRDAAETGDLAAASERAQSAAEILLAYGAFPEDFRSYGELGMAWRLLRQLSLLESSSSVELAKAICAQPDFARAIAYAVWAGEDRLDEVYAVVEELLAVYGERLSEAPEAAAAIAVVFDSGQPPVRLEGTLRIADPVSAIEMYGFILDQMDQMVVDPRDLPVELLVHTVDASASLEDLQWAARQYRNRQTIGKSYNEIDYDHSMLENDEGTLHRAPGPFGLPKIRECGGVCRHQGYYAEHVGKAIGVPTARPRATGPDMGHVWVGYLRVQGRRVSWDFDEGRWEDYELLRGELDDPQTLRGTSDEWVALRGDLKFQDRSTREAALSMIDASRWIEAVERRRVEWPPAVPEGLESLVAASAELHEATGGDGEFDRDARRRNRGLPEIGDPALPRAADSATRWWFLDRAARVSPAMPRMWSLARSWSREMTDDQRRYWFEMAYGLVGDRFPDVMVDLVGSLIDDIPDEAEQDRAWIWLAERVEDRPQLAIEVALERGALLERAGELEAASELYARTARRHANGGPTVTRAMDAMIRLFEREGGDPRTLVATFSAVFKRVTRPDVPGGYGPFTSYVQVGRRYVTAMTMAGMDRKATQLSERLMEFARD